MSAVHLAFIRQRSAAKSAGIAIVRNILQKNEFPDGITTKELYKLAIKEPAPANFESYPLRPAVQKPQKKDKYAAVREVTDKYPPNPDHPIRSINFLKNEILEALRNQREIRTFRQVTVKPTEAPSTPATKKERKALTASHAKFVWKVTPPKNIPPPPKVKEVIGTEVGVGADISHLNKRRQRARLEKVDAAVFKMKALNNIGKQTAESRRIKAAYRPLDGRPYYRAEKLKADAEL